MTRYTSPALEMLQSLSSYNLSERLNKYQGEITGEQGSPEDGLYDIRAIERAESDAAAILEIYNAFKTGSFGGQSVRIKDVLMSKDYPQLFYAATEILIRERIIPNRIITANLFQTIPYNGTSMNVTIRTMGGVEVEEVPEGAEFPETSSAVSDQAYRINIEIKKYGAKVAASRELLESDNWGIFAYTVQSLADELLNKKEKLAVTMLNNLAGYTLIDNANAANVPLGSTTGRGIDGSQNGALSIDDLYNILSWMQMRGYNIDTIIIHPFAWAMWARDPEIREVVMEGGVVYTPQGSAAPGWQMPWGGLGAQYHSFGSSIAQTSPAQAQAGNFNTVDPVFGKLGISPYAFPNLTPFGATFMTTPKFVGRALKVLVSPLVPYYKISSGSKAGKFATNVIFADSSKGGLILQKEGPTMEEWKDIDREVNFIKIRERFGMALQEQGRAIAVARNVVVDRTYTFDNVNSRQLSELTTNVNLI